jgi:hypothetical protein
MTEYAAAQIVYRHAEDNAAALRRGIRLLARPDTECAAAVAGTGDDAARMCRVRHVRGHAGRRFGVLLATVAAFASMTAPAIAVDMTVTNVEVTQAIQTPTNTIRLVAGRSTAVRATLMNNDGGAVAGVTGALHVFRNGVEVTPAAGLPAINQPFNAPAAPQRANENDTLNFELTGAAAAILTASNDVDFRVDVAAPGDSNTGNNTLTAADLDVAAHTTPRIFYTRINYTPAGTGVVDPSVVQPGVGDAFLKGIWAVNDNDPALYQQGLFPTLTYSNDPNGTGVIEWPSTNEGNLINDLLASCRQLIVQNGLGPDQTTYLYGWLNGNPTDHNGLTSNVRVAYGNTQDIRYQRTFAHEFGHIIGNPDGGPMIGEVGWDVGARLPNNPAANNVTGGAKPTTLFDVMVAGQLSAAAWIDPARYTSASTDPDLGNGPDASPDRVKRRLRRRVLVVQGTFDRRGRRLVDFEPAFRYPWVSEPGRQASRGRYRVVVRRREGKPIMFRFDPTNGDDAGAEAPGTFEAMIPVTGTISSIQIQSSSGKTSYGRISRTRSAPKLTIRTPEDGDNLGEQTRVRFSATDPDTANSRLMFNAAYSPDAGRTFVPIAVDLRNRSFVFDSTEIQASKGRGLIRVFASDGINTTFTDVRDLTTTAASFPAP